MTLGITSGQEEIPKVINIQEVLVIRLVSENIHIMIKHTIFRDQVFTLKENIRMQQFFRHGLN